MNRQQRRAMERRDQKEKTKTYNMTPEGLKARDEKVTNDAINQALVLLLTLPLEVLMDHYWPKSYGKRIPEFTNHVLEYYERWQNGELDMDKLKEDLWVYGGVRLEADK